VTTATQQTGTELYHRFLDAFNEGRYDEVAEVIAADFVDHHAGFEIDGIDSYLAALRGAHDTLAIHGDLEELLSDGDRVVACPRPAGTSSGRPPRSGGSPMGGWPSGGRTTTCWACAASSRRRTPTSP
jgi:predicted ester cyclase